MFKNSQHLGVLGMRWRYDLSLYVRSWCLGTDSVCVCAHVFSVLQHQCTKLFLFLGLLVFQTHFLPFVCCNLFVLSYTQTDLYF